MNRVNGRPVAGLIVLGQRTPQIETTVDQFVQRFKDRFGLESIKVSRPLQKSSSLTILIGMGKSEEKSQELKQLASTLADLSNYLDIHPIY